MGGRISDSLEKGKGRAKRGASGKIAVIALSIRSILGPPRVVTQQQSQCHYGQ